MEQEIYITPWFQLSKGKVNLNEIVYRLQEVKNPFILLVLEKILRNNDDLIAQRLSHHWCVIPPRIETTFLVVSILKGYWAQDTSYKSSI